MSERYKSPGRRCARCGEPVKDHERQKLPTDVLMSLLQTQAGHPAYIRSRVRAEYRVCPVERVKRTTDEEVPRVYWAWVPGARAEELRKAA